MKKLFFLCTLLFITIPLYSFAQTEITGIPLQTVSMREDLTFTTADEKTIDYLKHLIFLPKKQYDKEESMDMINTIGLIHPNILQALTEGGVKIKLFNGILTDEPAFEHLKGEHPKGWSSQKTWEDVPGAGGTLIVAAKIGHSDPGMGHGSINLELHEIGHSVDKIIYHISNDEEFLEIWEEEVRSLFPNRDYFINFPEEYFAETFAMYYLGADTKEKLQQLAPHTYSYIQNLENKEVKNEILLHI